MTQSACTRLLMLVPARGGSKRLPRKNVRLLAGRSLLDRTQDAIAESNLSAPCLLSTDDDEIAAVGRRLGWLVPFRRPASLSADDTETLPVALHALDWFASVHGSDPDLLLLLQVTSPFRRGHSIRTAYDRLLADPEADAVIGVKSINLGPDRLFRGRAEGYLAPLGNDHAGPTYVPNGAIYLIRCGALRAQNTFYPEHALPLPMDYRTSIDIDTEDDWKLAEALIASGMAERPLPREA